MSGIKTAVFETSNWKNAALLVVFASQRSINDFYNGPQKSCLLLSYKILGRWVMTFVARCTNINDNVSVNVSQVWRAYTIYYIQCLKRPKSTCITRSDTHHPNQWLSDDASFTGKEVSIITDHKTGPVSLKFLVRNVGVIIALKPWKRTSINRVLFISFISYSPFAFLSLTGSFRWHAKSILKIDYSIENIRSHWLSANCCEILPAWRRLY